jgi:hypothetical protein
MSPAMHDRFAERLSEYLDGGLDETEHRAIGEHVKECAACAETLDALRTVKETAAALPDAPPGADLWPGIAARIGGDRGGSPAIRPLRRVGAPTRAPRRVSFSMPQLVAAGVAVAVVSAGAMWLTLRREAPVTGQAPSGESPLAGWSAEALIRDPLSRDAAEDLGRLRRILSEGRDRLDPRTVRTLEDNLRIIEIAIAQSRRALDDDPGDPYVREHLTETMKRKVELMQRATVLASAP